jgi:hypothetical protein
VNALFERYVRASSWDKQGLIKQLSDELEIHAQVEEEETKLFPLVESRLAGALASIGIELQQRKNELAAMRQASV